VFSSKKIPPDGANRGHYRNAQLDALLDRSHVETDRDKRRAILADVQRIVADDVPYLNLWYPDNICVHRDAVRIDEIAPSGDYTFLDALEFRAP
jgi:peptide/nickel transport system substrate-binding protein